MRSVDIKKKKKWRLSLFYIFDNFYKKYKINGLKNLEKKFLLKLKKINLFSFMSHPMINNISDYGDILNKKINFLRINEKH